MDFLKQALGALFVLSGIAVAVLLMVTPLFHDGSPEYPAWQALNWVMAVMTAVALVIACIGKYKLYTGEQGGAFTLDVIRVNAVFLGAIVLAMWFFWEWFWTLNPSSETGDAVTSHLIYFPLVDALYVVITLTIGGRLWCESRNRTGLAAASG